MKELRNSVCLETFDRQQGIDVCAALAKHLEGQIVIAVTGSEGCGKSLVSDSMVYYFDDDKDVKKIPNDGKSVMEEEPGDALAKVHSKTVMHGNQVVRLSIVRNEYHLKNMEEFEGTDIIFFLHSWTDLPKLVNPSLSIDMKHVLTNRELFDPKSRGNRVHRKWGIEVREQSLIKKLSQTLVDLQKESDYRVKRDKPTLANTFLKVVGRAIDKLKSPQALKR